MRRKCVDSGGEMSNDMKPEFEEGQKCRLVSTLAVQTDDKNELFHKPRGVVHGVKFARTGSAHAAEIKMCTSLGRFNYMTH